MLTARELEMMRAQAEESMPFTCTISAPGTTTRDAYGEDVAGSTTETAAVCGVRRPSGREVVTGGGVVEAGDAVLRFPFGTSVPANSVITRQATDDLGAAIYRVKAPLGGKSYETALEVLATEV